MRLKTVSIQNFRLIADSTIEIPTGLTLVNGENGLGKSSIFQAILWCLYGPDALGDNQTSLVRQGHRDMLVSVAADTDQGIVVITRNFSLSPNGKTGRTELALIHPETQRDFSGGTVAETQNNINNLFGTRDIFMATAYVDQYDGPGAFLRSKPAEQRQQLRELLNISDDWDVWNDLAKLKHKTVADRIVGNLGRVGAAQEFIDQNSGVEAERFDYANRVEYFEGTIKKLNLNLEDLQDAQDEVDKVVAENERRQFALNLNDEQLAAAMFDRTQAYDQRDRLNVRLTDLPALDEERKVWLAGCEFWDDRNTEYQELVKAYTPLNEAWHSTYNDLRRMYDYYEQIDLEVELRSGMIKRIDDDLKSGTATICPTCNQKLATVGAVTRVNATREKRAEERATHVEAIESQNDQVDLREIEETIEQHLLEQPLEPVSPGARPVFESETEWNAAKSAETDIAAVDAEIKTRAEQVNTLSLAREELPTPDEYDLEAYVARAQTIGKVNDEIEQAETDKRDRERLVVQAETIIFHITQRKEDIAVLEIAIGDDQKLQKELDIVVTGTGPNGARQLMIDQQLGDFQSEVNQRLNTLLPGFSIYFDTQAESGRETFETLFTTPTGVIGWHGLSGAQRVAVGLSTRLALAQMVQARQGHVYSTWLFDEVDGSMRGENREAFVGILNKLREEGIDVLVVSHAGPVIERLDQRIDVYDAGGFTSVRQ